MNNQAIVNGSMARDQRADIVALWRQAVLGNAAARRVFLQRIMPAHALPAAPAPIELRPARRQQPRAAA
jgi:hypothetical protein